MSAMPAADRNLLLGVIALQTNFIDRDGLLAAIRTWSKNKTTSLGQILLDESRITAPQLKALISLVDLHLQRHGNDPQRSLQAVSTIDSVSLLSQSTDPDVQVNFHSISTVTGMPSVDVPTTCAARDGSRYRVVRPHARGGLGEVFVAEDTELHREVALKEIQSHRANDPVSRMRFILEAEITGGLEHPGVVPIYGLGTYSDGRPYYAMRFIHGDSLRTAIEQFYAGESPGRDAGERSLAFRQLLRRFVDVCNAIAYAHSRGVVHRDLKPANVMLGKFGETLVVDWGLAKAGIDKQRGSDEETLDPVLRPDSGSYEIGTRLGSALGTPGYMSPEQAAGRLGDIGPASDIYGLGATLHVLLYGRRPEAAALAETRSPISDSADDPEKARTKRAAPPALEAICRKAMALKPADRYASALDLAADVEHWLADEPASAYREPWTERASRWARRHRTAVVAAGVFLLSAVAALSTTTLLVLHEKRKTEAQKKLVEENYQRVRSLTKDSVDLIVASEAEFAADPAKDQNRRQILKSAAERYREYLAENPNDPEMQRKTALVYRYAANVHRLSWETEPADQLYRDALQIYQGLSDQDPEDQSYRLLLAETLRDRASLTANLGRLSDATKMLSQSIQIKEVLVNLEPARPGYRRSLANALLALAVVERSRGLHDQAELTAGKAGQIFCELLAKTPPDSQRYDPLLLGAAVNVMSLTQREKGQFDMAIKLHNDAIAALDGLFNKQGESVNKADVLSFLASFQVEKCRTWIQTGQRLPDADTNLSVAILTWERLYASFPQVPMYRENQAMALQVRGQVRALTNRVNEARADLDKSRQLLEDLTSRFEHIPGPHAELGRTCAELGRLERAAKNDERAKGWFSKAVAELKNAQKLAPASAGIGQSLKQATAELEK
jgi:serine/threonine-protein kinase